MEILLFGIALFILYAILLYYPLSRFISEGKIIFYIILILSCISFGFLLYGIEYTPYGLFSNSFNFWNTFHPAALTNIIFNSIITPSSFGIIFIIYLFSGNIRKEQKQNFIILMGFFTLLLNFVTLTLIFSSTYGLLNDETIETGGIIFGAIITIVFVLYVVITNITGTQKIKKQSKDLASKTVMIDGVEYILTPTQVEEEEIDTEEGKAEEIKEEDIKEETTRIDRISDKERFIGFVIIIIILSVILLILM